jgi:hypothetical protein
MADEFAGMIGRSTSQRRFPFLRGRPQGAWHTDAVVEAALDVQPLADARRQPLLGHDRLTQRGIGGREHDREHDRLKEDELAEQRWRRSKTASRATPRRLANSSPMLAASSSRA